ncbi:MAG: S1C family serine protease [Thermoguttaceae bacterium]
MWKKLCLLLAALCCAGPLQAGESAEATAAVAVASADSPPAPASPYWLGVEVFTVSPALRAQLGLADREGLVVEAMPPGSPAEKAGVKLYDVLVKAGGKKVEDVGNLVAAMMEAKDGKLTLEVIRGGKPQTIVVTLGKRPKGWLSQPTTPGDPGDLAKLVERLRREGGEGPVQLRFFRPGVILPPRAPLLLYSKLPENTSVAITREGDKPAKIVVKQGEQKWEITENEINKLPESLRPAVEQMLGHGDMTFAAPGVPMIGEERPEARLEKRLDELSRQVDQLRKALEQSRGAPPRGAAPPASPPPPPPQGGGDPPPLPDEPGPI